MKVTDYMPKLYINNIHMNNILNSEEFEFETNLKPAIEQEFNNTCIATADLYTLKKYAKLTNLNIDTDNEEYLREQLIARLNNTLYITKGWLKDYVKNVLGTDNFELYINYSSYIIYIKMDMGLSDNKTKQQLRDIIPANMEINYDYSNLGSLVIGSNIRQKEYINLVQGEVMQ